MKPWMMYAALLIGAGCVGCTDPSGAGGTTVGSTTGVGGGASAGVGGATTATSSATTSSSGQGGATGSTSSAGGGGGEDTCADQGVAEGNETMETATQIAGGSDCDDLSTQGTIDGPDDVDWYLYVQTADELGCNVNPARDWAVSAGHTLRVCKYVECQVDGMSPDTVSCNDGSTADTQGGLKGCCHTAPFDVGVGLFGCDGSDDLLNVYTRIDEPDAEPDTCAHYNFNYTF